MYARGYTFVGVQELCEHAGLTKGSFYHFFPSKQALTLEVIDKYDDWYRSLLESAMTADLPPLEQIGRLFELIYEYHCTTLEASGQMKGCPIGNLAAELRSQDLAFRRRLGQTFDGWVVYFERALRRAVASGEISGDLDPGTSAQAILAYLEGIALLATTKNDPELFRRLARRASQLARVEE